VTAALPLLVIAGVLLPFAAVGEPLDVETPLVDPGQPRLLLARRPGQTATVRITFTAGAVDDGGRKGLTRLGQHALLAANRRVDFEALLLGVHASAGELTVETRQRDCAFSLTADRRDFGPLARQLLTAVLSPQLDAARFPSAQARAMRDGLQQGGGQDFLTLVAALAVEDGRYRNEPYGDRDSLEALTFQDVAAHVRDRLAPANATIVVTGAFDREELLRMAHGFGGGRAIPVARPTLGVPFRTRKLASSELYILGYQVRYETPRDAAVARLATALIDGELWRRFRQAGLGYSYTVTPLRSAWLDLLVLLVPASDPSALDLSGYLLETVERVREGRYDDGQLERARRAALADLVAIDRDPGAMAHALAEGGAGWHGRAVAEELRSLDREALGTVLRGWFTTEHSLSVYMGPRP